MNLIELSNSDKNEYNRLLQEKGGSFLQSWEWGDWQEQLGRKVYRFKFNTVAFQVVCMPVMFEKYYVYAPYVNLELRITDYELLLEELQKRFSDALFLRIEPVSVPQIHNSEPVLQAGRFAIQKSKNIQPGKTLVLDLTKSEEELLADMHSKTRYNIKVATKHEVEIKDEFAITNGHGLYFEESLKLISETAQRQGFKTFTADYYKKMVDFFTLHHREGLGLHIYKAIYKNKLLATAIMLDFGSVRTFLFGGSSSEDKNVMAPYLLHFRALMDAKHEDKTVYDFWGIETSSGETPGFVRFKLGFGGTEKQYAGAYDIPFSKLWYTIYTIVRGINRILK